MSLKINSQAANSTAKTTQREINFRQWIPEADAECDLYGENGERMPYYPARPRQQGPYERDSQQIQIFKCPEGSIDEVRFALQQPFLSAVAAAYAG